MKKQKKSSLPENLAKNLHYGRKAPIHTPPTYGFIISFCRAFVAPLSDRPSFRFSER